MKLRHLLSLVGLFFMAEVQAKSYYQSLTICYIIPDDSGYEERYFVAKDAKLLSCFCGDMPVIFSLYEGDIHAFCKMHYMQACLNLK